MISARKFIIVLATAPKFDARAFARELADAVTAATTTPLLLAIMAATVRPKVGIGVCVLSPDHPGCVLLGQRLAKTAAGVGTWALPGGHLEHGESWAACAEREVLEETGLNIKNVRVGTIMNVVDAPTNYHYVVMFMVGDAAAGATPVNCEPDKCAGWSWHKWSGEFPSPVFKTLSEARAIGFNPFKTDPQLLQDRTTVGTAASAGDNLLFEKRGEDATVAAGKYTPALAASVRRTRRRSIASRGS